MLFEFDVILDKKSLSRFLLFHNYAKLSGILGVVISVAAVVVLVMRWSDWTGTQKGILVTLALLFTVLQPMMLLMKGRKQLQQEEFQLPFHYIFDEKGIMISQKEQKQQFAWKEIRKIIYRKDAIYVYMSTVSAFILPESQCDGHFSELVDFMKERREK
ncbi:MAG: YcxB family protein [Lachnospiraceae bacterium]|nr:YcxB family protein [Lachnospiraceae bacterium]